MDDEVMIIVMTTRLMMVMVLAFENSRCPKVGAIGTQFCVLLSFALLRCTICSFALSRLNLERALSR